MAKKVVYYELPPIVEDAPSKPRTDAEISLSDMLEFGSICTLVLIVFPSIYLDIEHAKTILASGAIFFVLSALVRYTKLDLVLFKASQIKKTFERK